MMDDWETDRRKRTRSAASARGLRAKALAEFPGDSEEERVTLSGSIWTRLQAVMAEWAPQADFARKEAKFGWSVRTQWFPDRGNPTELPIDSVVLYLDYFLPEEPHPLQELTKVLSPEPVLSHRMILASLLLNELETNNIEGALKAAEALDETSSHLRRLAERRQARTEDLREYGRRGAQKNKDNANELREKILAKHQELIAEGKNPHQTASIIARELHCHPSTVRRHLRKALPNRQRP